MTFYFESTNRNSKEDDSQLQTNVNKKCTKHVFFHAGIQRVRITWNSQRFLDNQSRISTFRDYLLCIELSKTVQLLIHIQVMSHLHDA